jgi:hypothetical protein
LACLSGTPAGPDAFHGHSYDGIVFWLVDRPGGEFWNYLLTSWKFPSIATATFAIACQIYSVPKCRLEHRNRELEQLFRIVTSDQVFAD